MEHVDVIIIGAGVSGIGAATQLQHRCPTKSYLMLESRGSLGGTWDLFNYPGIRSDSDMFTYSYALRPWTGSNMIADGDQVIDYLKATTDEFKMNDHIRYHHTVISATWSTQKAKWTLGIQITGVDETQYMSCSFVFFCSGYYNKKQGYTPEFKNRKRYQGEVYHPQHWHNEIDYSNKRVIIIGSGATTMTMAPAMAKTAKHITILQRSPSYVFSRNKKRGKLGILASRVLPRQWLGTAARWLMMLLGNSTYTLSKRYPAAMKRYLSKKVVQASDNNMDISKHFSPSYDPWQQRLCVIIENDLFKAIKQQKITMVTDQIEEWTEKGIRLVSGSELTADLIITATGFDFDLLDSIQLTVDGNTLTVSDCFLYRGVMLSGIPNHGFWLGYFNATYTLKVDATSIYLCRLINNMDKKKHKIVTAEARQVIACHKKFPFYPNYVARNRHKFPKISSKSPWNLSMNPVKDALALRYSPLKNKILHYK